MASDLTAPSLRKRRGVTQASITRLEKKLRSLEAEPHDPEVVDKTKHLATKLEALDSEFRHLHLLLVDLLDEEGEEMEREQEKLDKHDDDIASLSIRMQQLVTTSKGIASHDASKKVPQRKLSRLEQGLRSTENALSRVSPDDTSLLKQHVEKLADFKNDLSTIYDDLASMDLELDDELFAIHMQLENLHFDCSHTVKKLLASSTSSAPVVDSTGVRLPKLEVPTFNGDVLHWKQFWEQFSISVHDRTNLSDAEKLVYLQQAVKGGTARNAIEGLSRTGDHYREAVDCLLSRYNRPRLIHRAHVRVIMDAPPMKDGSGKELRLLHDVIQQHVRALKSMKYEPSGAFLTSVIELKLDIDTMFEWQKHSQAKTDVPHFDDLLDFIDLRAQASETSQFASSKKSSKGDSKKSLTRPVPSFPANADSASNHCVLCDEKHPLYVCSRFKSMSHDSKHSTLKQHRLCINCLSSGHVAKNCKSSNRCKRCQRPHHTLMHIEQSDTLPKTTSSTGSSSTPSSVPQVPSNAAVKLKSSSLLMTCLVMVTSPSGLSVEARALLDNASSSCFVSERLAQNLSLPRVHQKIRVSGIAGSMPSSPIQSVCSFQISPAHHNGRRIEITAIVVPKVTCDLPVSPVPFDLSWNHLSDLPLADPNFGQPGRIDVLLGVDIFVDVLLQGRRTGPPGTPVALETEFGWVLSGSTDQDTSGSVNLQAVAMHAHTAGVSDDDVLRRFWEIEEPPLSTPPFSAEERDVVLHFDSNHSRTPCGRFVVPLPKKPEAPLIGESRSQAVRRFVSLEKSLTRRDCFRDLDAVMQEYLDLGHAEKVPNADLEKTTSEVFYLPIHAVYKASSSTTKIRAVFDASAKSSTGVSLNDTLLVGPTVHPPLIDILLRFRLHRVALVTDVSKMYRAVELVPADRDLHRFVWRSSPNDTLQDYRMTRVTFGVCASCFAANMSVKQNAIDLAHKYPLAAEAVLTSFYVDDGLTGADDVIAAIELRHQLQDLFSSGGFLLRKWDSNEPSVLEDITPELRERHDSHPISDSNNRTKTLGLEWNQTMDQFHLSASEFPPTGSLTKRALISDIAKIYDILGWFSPATVTMKILFQRLWELKVGWDCSVPEEVQDVWRRWRSELPLFSTKGIPRCYYPKEVTICSVQLHGYSDASESAYAGVVYLRMVDSVGDVHVSLVTSKTKVSPIKRLSIPRLELCGAQVLAKLLHHVKEVLQLPLSDIFAWTDSTIVLNWLAGNPRRFKTYVGNRVTSIIDLIPPERWNHVAGTSNPADCASRGLFPAELLCHELWWHGPPWLQLQPSNWPQQGDTPLIDHDGDVEVCHVTPVEVREPIVSSGRYSTFSRLQHVTAWLLRFVKNCRLPGDSRLVSPSLSTSELRASEQYWILFSQRENFSTEMALLQANQPIHRKSSLLSLHPLLDSEGILRVGGREANAKLAYSQRHPIILHGKHPVSKLMIRSEHVRLLHAGPTLLSASLSRRFHVVNLRKTVRSVTRQCITCRRQSVRPQPPLMGQLPLERVTPGCVFERVGVDYAGPFLIKHGAVRKPTLIKAYLCIFVSLAVKAVHLEIVSDLTSEAFIATLRRFIARRGHPSLIWSDNGTNFVGASREIKELYDFLAQQKTKGIVSDFCSAKSIEWRFIPERSPNFGGLWEAAVKSAKTHLKRIMGPVKFTFEEFSTVMAQVEACLNSRPLVPMSSPDDDGVEALTPGHFLIGQPLCALPDPPSSFSSTSMLRRWHLCQSVVRHFWQRWSSEYLTALNKFTKWHHPLKNLAIGDMVVVKEDSVVPTNWPLARVIQVYPGNDGIVRVASVQTPKGTYKRPVSKLALLVPDPNSQHQTHSV